MSRIRARGALRTALALLVGIALPLTLVAATDLSPSAAGREATATRIGPVTDNPLAGRPWGVYLGPSDMAWAPWTRSTGDRRALLDRIVLQPKAQWFGHWVPDDQIAGRIERFIANATGGDPEVLVQMAIFRMLPWEGDACRRLPTKRQIASYERWVDNAAGAIGSAHVALVLQPDGPFALCAPHHSRLPSHVIRYAARKFGALENTSVYIDAGAADWLRSDPSRALKILVPAGVSGVRGFALNSTHYDSTADEVEFGAAIVRALAERGILDKHFVVNTSSNGRPFRGYEYDGRNFDNARLCHRRSQQRCVTLGIPPTVEVADARWGLSEADRLAAAAYADAYLWFGRPWLRNQASPFAMKRALTMVRTTPY